MEIKCITVDGFPQRAQCRKNCRMGRISSLAVRTPVGRKAWRKCATNLGQFFPVGFPHRTKVRLIIVLRGTIPQFSVVVVSVPQTWLEIREWNIASPMAGAGSVVCLENMRFWFVLRYRSLIFMIWQPIYFNEASSIRICQVCSGNDNGNIQCK